MKEVDKEFLVFMTSSAEAAPNSPVLSKIVSMLAPSGLHVFLVHASLLFFAGLLTLIICPQFGMGGIVLGHHFIHMLASGGQILCAAFCASLYFGFVMALSHVFLPVSYKRKVQAHSGVFAAAIPALLMGLMMLGSLALGQFAVMGLLYCVTWYLVSMLIHISFTVQWRVYALS